MSDNNRQTLKIYINVGFFFSSFWYVIKLCVSCKTIMTLSTVCLNLIIVSALHVIVLCPPDSQSSPSVHCLTFCRFCATEKFDVHFKNIFNKFELESFDICCLFKVKVRPLF